MASQFHEKKKVRVLSLGTGEKVFNGFEDAATLTRLDYMTRTDEFMMNIDTYTAHHWL